MRLLCPHCKRVEILTVDEGLSRLIVERAPTEQLRREAARRGMKTLTDIGLEMVERGETSLADVMRVAPPDAIGD